MKKGGEGTKCSWLGSGSERERMRMYKASGVFGSVHKNAVSAEGVCVCMIHVSEMGSDGHLFILYQTLSIHTVIFHRRELFFYCVCIF